MKLYEFYPERQGRPESKAALDMEGRWPHIPPGFIRAYMIKDFGQLVTYLTNLEILSDEMLELLLDENFGLEARYELLDDWFTNIEDVVKTIETDTDPLVMGRLQIATTTWDLKRGDAGAGTDVLFTGTAQAVILESLIVRMPTTSDVTDDGTITSLAIATDDAEPGIIIPAASAPIASMTPEAQFAWRGALYISVGTEIEGTIAGGDADDTCNVIVTVTYRAVVSGGYLA